MGNDMHKLKRTNIVEFDRFLSSNSLGGSLQGLESPPGSSGGSGELVSIPMENGSGAHRASIELEERQPLKLEAERRESGKHTSSSQVRS